MTGSKPFAAPMTVADACDALVGIYTGHTITDTEQTAIETILGFTDMLGHLEFAPTQPETGDQA